MRSAGKGIAIGYAITLGCVFLWMILQEAEVKIADYICGMTNGSMLFMPENYKEKIIDGMKVKIIDTVVTGDMAVKTILISLIMTAVYLTAAYMNYKKSDRD